MKKTVCLLFLVISGLVANAVGCGPIGMGCKTDADCPSWSPLCGPFTCAPAGYCVSDMSKCKSGEQGLDCVSSGSPCSDDSDCCSGNCNGGCR